jgi:hypothetical protein
MLRKHLLAAYGGAEPPYPPLRPTAEAAAAEAGCSVEDAIKFLVSAPYDALRRRTHTDSAALFNKLRAQDPAGEFLGASFYINKVQSLATRWLNSPEQSGADTITPAKIVSAVGLPDVLKLAKAAPPPYLTGETCEDIVFHQLLESEYIDCIDEDKRLFRLRRLGSAPTEDASYRAQGMLYPGSDDPVADARAALSAPYAPPAPPEEWDWYNHVTAPSGYAFMRLIDTLPRLIRDWDGIETDFGENRLADVFRQSREAGLVVGGIMYTAKKHGLRAKVNVRGKRYPGIGIAVQFRNRYWKNALSTESGPWGGPELHLGGSMGGTVILECHQTDRHISQWFEDYCKEISARRAS